MAAKEEPVPSLGCTRRMDGSREVAQAHLTAVERGCEWMSDDEKPEWWKRRPSNATLYAWAAVITAVGGLIGSLQGCSPT